MAASKAIAKQEPPEIDLELISQQVKDGVARIKEVQAEITLAKKEAKKIAIKDMEDKPGYVAAKAFLSTWRPKRTALADERKTAIKPFGDIYDGISKMYNNAINEFATTEEPIKAAVKSYDDYWEKEKQDKIDAANKRIEDMIQLLVQKGLTYDPVSGFYTNGPMSFNRANLEKMEDATFALVLQKADEIYQVKIAEELEAKKKQELKADRIRQLVATGASSDGLSATMFDMKTQGNTVVGLEDIQDISQEEFYQRLTIFEKLKVSNKSVLDENNRQQQENLKEQARIREDAKKQQEEAQEASRKLQEQKDKQDKKQMELAGKELQSVGFSFDYSNMIWKFTNSMGTSVIGKGDILADNADELIETAKAQVESLKTKKAEKDAEDAARLQEAEALALKNQAKRKGEAKNDIQKIGAPITTLQEIANEIEAWGFDVIGNQARTLAEDINKALKKFDESITHLK